MVHLPERSRAVLSGLLLSLAEAGAVVRVDDRRVKADTKRFKEFIEGRRAATGAWRGDVSAG